jgi:hypothetical protein
MASFRYDKETGEVIPVEEWYEKYGETVGNSAVVAKSFTAFKSTVDGTIISDRRQLAAHNKRNGVTNIADYGEKHFSDAGDRMYKEKTGDTKAGEKDRRRIIEKQLYKHGMLK